jgi:uncharacterized protein YwqG
VILDWQPARPHHSILRKFHEQVWPQFPTAAEAIKIGGWPAWVQSPSTEDPLLLQIATCDDAEIMFGDCGTLYVFASESGGFACFAQCY